MQDRQIYISTTTILKVVAILVGLYVLYLLSNVVAIIFIGLFIAALIQPIADAAARYKIPRSLTVILVYLVSFGLLAAMITLLAPTIITQTNKVIAIVGERWDLLNDLIKQLRDFIDRYNLLSSSGLSGNLSGSFSSLQPAISALKSFFNTAADIFGGIATFLIVLVIAFYLVVQEDKAKTLVHDWVPERHRAFSIRLIEQLQIGISRWFGGQLLLSLIIGAMYFVGLSVIGVESALVLALFAALLEFIPYLGPILAGIPVVFIAFTQSITQGILALVLLILIQQAENNLIVPKIMQKAVGLNPLISIISMIVGLQLFGFMGALLAIPFATALMVAIGEIRKYRKS